MNPKQQRIKIAEVCGWAWESYEGGDGTTHFGWFSPNRRLHSHSHSSSDEIKFEQAECLPDYLNDIGLIMRAVASSMIWQSGILADRYINYLREATGVRHEYVCLALTEANAEQRCEAFLKTLERWDGK